jgi:RNA polymerase sigma factor (sigma-70 family)
MAKLLSLFKSDLKLIESMKSGDDSVLGELYDKNIRMILKYVNANHGTDYEASELLQDALVVLWEKVQKEEFVLTSKISTFIYAVVKRKWLQELARRKKHVNIDEVIDNPGDDTSVEEDLQDSETIDIVKRCIKQLPPLCQKILVSYYYEERTMAEICKISGLANENVAKSKKYQCKKQLEQLVKAALSA